MIYSKRYRRGILARLPSSAKEVPLRERSPLQQAQVRVAERAKAMRRGDLETLLQIDTVEMFEAVLPPEVIWWHVPNGGQRNKLQAITLWAMGAKRGVPDLQLLWPGAAPGISEVGFIELKKEGGRPSPEQKDLHPRLCAIGCHVGIARSLPEVRALLDRWRVPMRLSAAATAQIQGMSAAELIARHHENKS